MRRQVGDIALSLALAVGCTLEVWAPRVFGSTHMTGPRVAVYLSYLVAAAAVAARRRWPLAATVVVVTSLASEWLAFGAPEGFGVFSLLIVAAYSVAAHEDRPRALVGLAAVLGAIVVWELRDPMQTTLKHHVQAAMWLSPALIGWLLGAYLRTRRLYVLELQERAEHERERSAPPRRLPPSVPASRASSTTSSRPTSA